MKILLGVLLLLNLALYLVLGPYDVPAKLLPGGLDEHAGSGLTLVTEADPAQLEVARNLTPATGTKGSSEGGPTGVITELPGPGPAMSTPRGRVAICYSLGTLRDRLLVDRVLGELGADGIEAKVRTEERRGDLSGYWVLLPARPSLEAAQAQIDELQQRGIDSFVVGTGEYRNAVSLGFFHGRRAAEELEARIRAQGYNPRLVLRYQQESQYWLDLDETASERFDDDTWARLGESYPMLGRYLRDCG
jgi:hypothetical protein